MVRRSDRAARFAALACSCLIATAAGAEPVEMARRGASILSGPGDSFLSASSWECEYLAPLSSSWAGEPGFGVRASLRLEGLPIKGASFGIDAGYRWIDSTADGGDILSMPGVGIDLAYRIPLFGLLSFHPSLGAGADFPLGGEAFRAAWSARIGAAFSLRMVRREYLALGASLSIPLAEGDPLLLGLSLGLRSERAWMLREDRKPETAASHSSSPSAEAPSPSARKRARLSAVLEPELFSPDGDGLDDVLAVLSDWSGPRPWSWKLLVRRISDDTVVKTYKGSGAPPERIEWDGYSEDGVLAEPGEDFEIVLSVLAFGTEEARGKATIDILVVEDGDRYKIRVPDIRFAADSDAVDDKAFLDENRKTLTRIATLFKRFPGYGLIVEGHTNSVFYADPERFKAEEEKVLKPLSQRRADTVRAALISVGVDASRIRASGMGGSRPLYPFSDEENAGKNRRVEFILVKSPSLWK
jgi:outer membrane protein OmpA-like peptidoglycan-associated protein